MATEVVIKSTPFNSVESGGKYDRPVFAQDFADFFNVVAGHGIVVSEGSFDSPEMKPTIGGDSRSVSVATGYAVLGGRLAEIEQTTQIDAEIGGVKDRYDRLVLEMSDDLENRNTKLKLLKGVEGAGKPPDIVQEKNFFQLSLCKWKQSAGSALISEFVDERKDRSVCGFFYPLSIVTDPMLNSYLLDPQNAIPKQADLNSYKDFGNFISPSAAVSKSLKNCPMDDQGFSLRIMRGSGGIYRVQEVIAENGGRLYRHYDGSAWSGWMTNTLVKLLWKNASPSSLFPPQDVAIVANEGDLIGIEFESQAVLTDRRITWLTVKAGMVTELVTVQSTSDGGNIFVTRRAVTITNTGLINFDKGYYRYVGASNNRNDGYSIPTAVYIAKGVI